MDMFYHGRRSIERVGAKFQLVNDVERPGIRMVYGTDDSGEKHWVESLLSQTQGVTGSVLLKAGSDISSDDGLRYDGTTLLVASLRNRPTVRKKQPTSNMIFAGTEGALYAANLEDWIHATLNQVNVTDDGTGGVTLSLPQDIDETSSPTFADLSLTGKLNAWNTNALSEFHNVTTVNPLRISYGTGGGPGGARIFDIAFNVASANLIMGENCTSWAVTDGEHNWLTVLKEGLVGIRKSIPGYALEVVSSGWGQPCIVAYGGSSVGTAVGLESNAASGQLVLGAVGWYTTSLTCDGVAGDTYLDNSEAGHIYLRTAIRGGSPITIADFLPTGETKLRKLRLWDLDDGHYVQIYAPSTLAGHYNIILPLTEGTENQYLIKGASSLGWTSVAKFDNLNGPSQFDNLTQTNCLRFSYNNDRHLEWGFNSGIIEARMTGNCTGLAYCNSIGSRFMTVLESGLLGFGCTPAGVAGIEASSRTTITPSIAAFGGTSHDDGVNHSTASGEILIGIIDTLRAYISYDYARGKLIIGQTWDNAEGDILFQTRASGTAVDALTLKGSGIARFNQGADFDEEVANVVVANAVTIDFRLGAKQKLALTDNATLTLTPSGGVGNCELAIEYSGDYTPTFPGDVYWARGVTPTWTKVAGKTDRVMLFRRAAKWHAAMIANFTT